MKTLRLLSVLVLFTFIAAGCGRKNSGDDLASTGGTPEKGDWIIERMESDPSGLSYYLEHDNYSSWVYNLTHEGLITQDWKTMEFTPSLAKEMPEISSDHLVWTFKLRTDIKFSDGHPFTANDVVFTFKVAKNPLIIECAPVRNYVDETENVEALNDSTVRFTQKRPYFQTLETVGGNPIIPKHILDPENITDKYTFKEINNVSLAKRNPAIQKFADWFSQPEHKREPKYLIGSGPYILEKWETASQIVLRRNDQYWNSADKWGKAYADKIIYRIITDQNAALTALKGQQVDLVDRLTKVQFVKELDTVKNNHLKKAIYTWPTFSYIGWNNASPFFSNKLVRMAMSKLCNVEQIIKTVYLGYARAITGPYYYQRPEYNKNLKPIAYDPEGARKLLAEAGWTDSDGDGILDKMVNGKKMNFEFTFMNPTGSAAGQQIALIMTEELKKVGIKAEVTNVEFAIMQKNQRLHQFDAYLASWAMPSSENDNYQIWHSSQADNQGSNYVSFRNSEADDLIVKIRAEFDKERRYAYHNRLQEIFQEEQPYTFTTTPQNTGAYHRRFQGVEFFGIRPGYYLPMWWVAKGSQKYASSTAQAQ